MKKVLFLLFIICFALASCSKNEFSAEKENNINLEDMISLMGENISNVKLKLGKPITELTQSSQTDLYYFVKTKEGDYKAQLRFGEKELFYEHLQLEAEKQCIDSIYFTQILSNKLKKIYTYNSYTGNIYGTDNIEFNSNIKFWEYVTANKPNSGKLQEIWYGRKGNIKLTYDCMISLLYIEINKK